jgi:hypothetical protein
MDTRINFDTDIDIDVANRDLVLSKLPHTLAMMHRNEEIVKHNTGIYLQNIPVNPFTNIATIDYKESPNLGYFKIDILNNSVYELVRDEEHLDALMVEPNWALIYDRAVCEQLVHIANHYDLLLEMPEAVDTFEKVAMFLAVIRPGKRHLVGKKWDEVAKTVWDKPTDGSYYFKMAHSISYAHLVGVHLNLLNDLPD